MELELELELELESVKNWNPIPYSVWLVRNGIGIQFHSVFGWQTCQMNLISEI